MALLKLDEGVPRGAIEDGDLVIIQSGFRSLQFARIKRGGETHFRIGLFRHDDIIGKPFGSRWEGIHAGGKRPKKRKLAETRPWVRALFPTPEMWTTTLPHRTQVVYLADISNIVFQLEVCPGAIVFEAGTGSGSLSTSLARAVAPNGHLYTFEFHEQRAQRAREDFDANKLSSVVTVTHRDVLRDGFGLAPDAYGSVDAIILDLPAPWDAARHVKNALRPDGVVCIFTPNTEQANRAVEALRAESLGCFRTIEVLLREYDIRALCEDSVVSLWRDPAAVEKAAAAAKEMRHGKTGLYSPDQGDPHEHQIDLSLAYVPEHLPHQIVMRARRDGASHTAYLTFARRIVEENDGVRESAPQEPAASVQEEAQ